MLTAHKQALKVTLSPLVFPLMNCFLTKNIFIIIYACLIFVYCVCRFADINMSQRSVSRKKLESYLQEVDVFDNPKMQLEQYPTTPHLAGLKNHDCIKIKLITSTVL